MRGKNVNPIKNALEGSTQEMHVSDTFNICSNTSKTNCKIFKIVTLITNKLTNKYFQSKSMQKHKKFYFKQD